MTLRSYEGGCHCGAIGYTFRTASSPSAWLLRACQCSFCRAHAVRSTSDPAGTLEFVERQPGRLTRYRFGRRTADFLICNRCGVYVGASLPGTPHGYGIINVNTLQPLPEGLAEAVETVYENETGPQRIARRVSRWTPLARPA